MRVGMLKGINYNSALNTYSSLPSYSATPIPYQGANTVAI